MGYPDIKEFSFHNLIMNYHGFLCSTSKSLEACE